jgi:hypothetical protein
MFDVRRHSLIFTSLAAHRPRCCIRLRRSAAGTTELADFDAVMRFRAGPSATRLALNCNETTADSTTGLRRWPRPVLHLVPVAEPRRAASCSRGREQGSTHAARRCSRATGAGGLRSSRLPPQQSQAARLQLAPSIFFAAVACRRTVEP